MLQNISYSYTEAIKAIKQAILKSRYKAAMQANREMLMLYFGVGEYISKNSREGSWGTNAIEVISAQLQKELPGLRGFSATNLRNMRLFYEAWQKAIPYSQNHQLLTDDLQTDDIQEINNDLSNHQLITDEIHQMPSDDSGTEKKTFQNRQLSTDDLQVAGNEDFMYEIIIRQLSTDDLATNQLLNYFVSIGFTHHIIIIAGVKQLEERLFYIEQCARGFWSVEKLQYNIKSHLYTQQGSIINNFIQTISEADFRGKALRSFKDEYLLDFVNIEDPDEEDERLIENQIEFAFYDTSKPMGVATYRTSRELPPEYKGILPDVEKLKELMEE